MKNENFNCIWIMCDQLRAQSLSCNGDPNVHTPNIDLLARTGVNFTGAVGGSPLCCPCRGSMLTSLYPHKCVPGHEYRMPPESMTIADAFKQNGYHTAYVGKWHLDGFKESGGRAAKHIIPKDRRGHFDYWVGYENNNSQWDCWVHGGDDKREIPLTQLNGYETDCLTDIFLEHLDSVSHEKLFFGVLSVQPPHDPYIAPPEYMRNHTPDSIKLRKNVPDVKWVTHQARAEISGAYAMIENLDYNVGRVVEWLRKNGLYENTHIMFFSDHGDMHGSHGQFRKTNPYEESIRVPMIISGCIPHYDKWRIREVNNPINHVDIAPTSLGLCGLPILENFMGTDYSGLRIERNEPLNLPDSAYLQIVVPTKHGDSLEYAWRGIVTVDGYKYVSLEHMPYMMYDLNTDPYEQVNLAHNTKYHAKRNELENRLKRWINDTDDSFEL